MSKTQSSTQERWIHRLLSIFLFSMPNFKNLTFVKVVWHGKMLFGMYIIVWHILAFFSYVGRINILFGIFEKLVSIQLKF